MKNQIGKLFVWISMVICFTTLIVSSSYAAEQASSQKEETISEEIKPELMSAEQGYCYTAVLALDRTGDQNGKSECILLEDGKPLSAPHSFHKNIRETGNGKYSHWGNKMLYFSASDNSDPRTNGRKYTLASTKKQ